MKNVKLFFAALLALVLTSCEHKELCLDHTHIQNVKVVFDWRNAPDASPSSVTALFFPTDKSQAQRYNFVGRDGGPIRLSIGAYSALGMNNDHTDWARFRGTDDIETFEVYTDDATMLTVLGIDIRNIPRARETETERFASAPGMLWNHRLDDVYLDVDTLSHTITFYPEEAVCHYTVTILDVENLKYLHGAFLDATLSGMAEGFYHGAHAPTETPVTMPFVMKTSGNEDELYGQFLTFGECTGSSNKHIVTLYMMFDDGTAMYYTFDVTDQVTNAPDPHHVDIVIRGLKLPKPITNGGGFKPNVDDWVEQYEDVNMTT